MTSTLSINDPTRDGGAFGDLAAKIKRVFPPRLQMGLHYVADGPIHQAINRNGNFTVFDNFCFCGCCFLGLSNMRLERKLKAFADAFMQEARLFEQAETSLK